MAIGFAGDGRASRLIRCADFVVGLLLPPLRGKAGMGDEYQERERIAQEYDGQNGVLANTGAVAQAILDAVQQGI